MPLSLTRWAGSAKVSNGVVYCAFFNDPMKVANGTNENVVIYRGACRISLR
jgi:hypothetical protein